MCKRSLWNKYDLHSFPGNIYWFTVNDQHIFIKFFQLTKKTVDDARALMKYADPALGVKLEEQDYGGNCLIYDHDVPENPFHNFWVSNQNIKITIKKNS